MIIINFKMLLQRDKALYYRIDLPHIMPTLHSGSSCAKAINVPTVSFNRATTSISTSLRRLIASRSSCTTSRPSTPEHLKPLVQLTNWADVKPCWAHGNENVKPRGNCPVRPWSRMNNARQSAMWSNLVKRSKQNFVLVDSGDTFFQLSHSSWPVPTIRLLGIR